MAAASSLVTSSLPPFAIPAISSLAALLAFGLLPARASGGSRRHAALAAAVALFGMLGAVVMAAGILRGGSRVVKLPGFEILRLDFLTAIMFLLVSFLGAVVLRYSKNYLDGEPRQHEFTRWLCLTISAVLVLVVSGNLLTFTLAWMATSLSLHRLLTFYPERRPGLLAARKKFLISRLGDACLIGALVFTWRCFGTWDFGAMFAAVQHNPLTHAEHSACLGWTSVLLVAGALLKSAQFPFHSWLPDTMETPTPVSALMHAGIINAGGFLVVRLSPIVSTSPAALNALALIGAFTALFASIVMLTQTSIKRSLAYSTIAQMGFMMLQCGLGAFALAILHIVAHSLYKAHAFLSSGSMINMSRSAWSPSGRPSAHPLLLIATLLLAVAISFAAAWGFGVRLESEPGVFLLGSIFTMGIAYLLWNLWASSHRKALAARGILIAAGASLIYFSLHAIFTKMLASSLADYRPSRSAGEYAVMGLVALLFMAVLVFQSQLPTWSATRWGRWLYVHASNGFYLGTLANRVTLLFTGRILH